MSIETVTLEHPAHPERYMENGFNNDVFETLHTRFDGTSVSVLEIANVLLDADEQVIEARAEYEKENFRKLILTNEDSLLYPQLSGRLEKVGKFIPYFGKVALRTLQDEKRKLDVAKVTLTLAGKRQLGNWECTQDLDDFARAIPAKLLEEDPAARVYPLGDTSHRDKRYAYFSCQPDTDTTMTGKGFGIVRRRRPVADVVLPGLLPIEIFKESRAILITGETDQLTRELVEYDTTGMAEYELQAHTVNVAAAAGHAFERGIKELKGRTRDIIPVSSDYFVVMRNPLFYP